MRRPSSRSDCPRSMEVLRKLTIFRASHGSFLQPRRLNIANPETPQKGSGFPPTPRRKARSKSLPKLLTTPFSTLKRQSHTEQPQTLPVPSCVPFSMSGACGGKARPPRQAAMYVRGSFFGVLSGFKSSGEDFDSELRCSAAHAGTTKCSAQDSPTHEAWVFTIVVRKVHMILARQTSQKSGAIPICFRTGSNCIVLSDTLNPKAQTLTQQSLILILYMMAMEPYLPELVPLLLPPPEPSVQPLHCPHGFWNAPGSKGDSFAFLRISVPAVVIVLWTS